MKSVLNELRELYDETLRIFNDEELPWETKYDLIFSKSISGRIHEIIRLDYYDPDTSYKEDVTAFVLALEEKMER